MIPLYTLVYPQKAQDQYESPQLVGAGIPVPQSGKMTRWGGWGIQGNGVGDRSMGGVAGLGGLLPIVAGGYAVYWGCKNGHLPKELCAQVDVAPGKAMPGTCPPEFQMEGQCFCPVGAETADGGCAYPGAYTVDASGALPIGGGAPAGTPAEDKWLLAAAGLAVVVGGFLLVNQKKGRRLSPWVTAR